MTSCGKGNLFASGVAAVAVSFMGGCTNPPPPDPAAGGALSTAASTPSERITQRESPLGPPFTEAWPYGGPSSYRERQQLITSGVLHDGMTRSEAIRIMGGPTSETDRELVWYYNPDHLWHVAAGFRARKGDDGLLYNWRTDNW
jgi:hypothetical protein